LLKITEEMAVTDIKDIEILYQQIVYEYENNQSIAAIAKKLHTTQVRVQRVLITEGLWSSRRTKQVGELQSLGMTVMEIAEELGIDEKTVQTYLPYSRGQYGGNTTDDSARSKDYRDRMKTAAENMHTSAEGDGEMIQSDYWDDLLAGDDVDPELKLTYVDEKYSEDPYWNWDSIYKLHLELVSPPYYSIGDDLDLGDQERADLFRMGKASEGFSRDVLVSGAMTLHAMHYMIQKLFGWQNSHLHKFALSDEDFDLITEGKVKGWTDLCGSLLRFPDGDFYDACWDDDYKEGISVKNWYRRKYNGGYSTKAVGDNWLYNRQQVMEFKADCMEDDRFKDESTGGVITDDTLLKDVGVYFEAPYNSLMESLTAGDLFITGKSRIGTGGRRVPLAKWKERQSQGLDRMTKAVSDYLTDEDLEAAANIFSELKRWRESQSHLEHYMYTDMSAIREQTGEDPAKVAVYHDNLIRSYEMSLAGLKVKVANEPFFRTIYYNYDYGDDWWVKITCEEIYSSIHDTPYAPDERLEEIVYKNKPLCIAADGMNVVDDCGGMYGFLRMLRTINGKDKDEAREMKEWARRLGWTGRIYKPENMI
jgi:predicted transcriptional regulator